MLGDRFTASELPVKGKVDRAGEHDVEFKYLDSRLVVPGSPKPSPSL